MSKQIPLSQGKFATVDDVDYDWLVKNKWTYDPKGYAMRRVANVIVYMHRVVLNASGPIVVDHINGDGLDNRRENLRIVTTAENNYNQRPQKRPKTSRFKGVSLNRKSNRWQAHIKKGDEHRYLGLYDNEQDAARAYNAAARHYFGEYAFVNDVPDDNWTMHNLSVGSKTSGFRGVHYSTAAKKWKTQVQVSKTKIFLGYFHFEMDAARAYDTYVTANGLHFPLNFPPSTTKPVP